MKYTIFIYSLIIVSTFSPYTIHAEKVDRDKALLVAKNFLSERHPNPKFIFSPQNELELNSVGKTTFYVFNFDRGFIIVSAYDVVYPVAGYSFHGNFDVRNIPDALDFWLEELGFFMFKLEEHKHQGNPKIKDAWNKFLKEDFLPDRKMESIEPLIHTKWNQGCFYNSFFPLEPQGPCGYLFTGCVATAMGQVMKCYNFPVHGSGNHSYTTSYGLHEADFENTYYDWVGMEFELNDENDGVAELLFHSAIGINSQFFPNGTGGYDFDAKDALVDYFNYKETIQFYWRDAYSGDWTLTMRNEIEKGRPVLYGFADSSANTGHTAVLDGYQGVDFFHLNWGWGGSYNGYYYLDTITAGGYTFNYQHDAVIGIQPDIPDNTDVFPPENPVAEVHNREVNLTWNEPFGPPTIPLLGYYVFRNDTLLSEKIVLLPSYTDPDAPPGSNVYRIQSVYSGWGNGPSVTVEAYVSDIHESRQGIFKIYPNPASDFVMIKTNEEGQNDVFISLSDLKGRSVFSNNIELNKSGSTKINIAGIAPGVYLLYIKQGSETFSEKLLISR
jgi:hypothetical protein